MDDKISTLIKAKIPGDETGVELKRSTCCICADGCYIDAYIRNGELIKVDSCSDPNFSRGPICVKGHALREYVYSPDRLKSPLRRTGKRGSGEFEPISWSEAYSEIAEKLNGFKRDFGADSVVFYTGYSKWYRFMLHRLSNSFGSINYGTESSACYVSSVMANKLASGFDSVPDLKNARLAVAWSFSDATAGRIRKHRERGLKVIAIDPGLSRNIQNTADLHLRLRPGTDAALAHGLARILIENDAIDREFIMRYVYGFEEYAAYVKDFDLQTVSGITGLRPEEIETAGKMMMEYSPMALLEGNTGIIHHRNGMQTYRAINALAAITGNFDRAGGQLPMSTAWRQTFLPDSVLDLEFAGETKPQNSRPPIGSGRYPLWAYLNDEFQAMDMAKQILTGEPYPLKAIFALGLNARMFPESGELFRALEKIDFFVDTDLFMTDTAKYADIVLPACSSLERGELIRVGRNGLTYVEPVLEPLGESRSDVDIICQLAEALRLDDPLLRSGYDECCRYIIRELPFTLEELKASPRPLATPAVKYRPGTRLREGLDTPTGKYELKSSVIEMHPEWGLDALPTYRCPLDNADPEKYPLVLISGVRFPFLIHSRTHRLRWLSSLRPEPMADLNPEDAGRYGIGQSDEIDIVTQRGRITVKANLTHKMLPGTVGMHHNYSDADINSIIPGDHTDPYSGFPGYKSLRCAIERRNA